jgi:hypothetical protein
MRKISLTLITLCTLLWAWAVYATPGNVPPKGTRFPATGQTTVYAVGVDDGAVKAGAALSYTDNNDGTITDNNTKLMWEKKDAAGGLHDRGNLYLWAGRCSTTLTTLCGTDADCPTGESCTAGDNDDDLPNGMTIFQWVAQLNEAAFAGHTDWRVPNLKELQSIVDHQNMNPAVETAFNTNCLPGCTVTSCSCTRSGPSPYWSATTDAADPSEAWLLDFFDGDVNDNLKALSFYARAVRGRP